MCGGDRRNGGNTDNAISLGRDVFQHLAGENPRGQAMPSEAALCEQLNEHRSCNFVRFVSCRKTNNRNFDVSNDHFVHAVR